jgi:hypothetical protein
MTCYCFLRNISDFQKDGFTAYQSKILQDFKGLLAPFGAEVEYKPSHPKGFEKLHKFGSKTFQGVFVGYDQRAGGQWSSYYLVADWDEIEQADTARETHVHRVKEINVCLLNGKHRFPLAEKAV